MGEGQDGEKVKRGKDREAVLRVKNRERLQYKGEERDRECATVCARRRVITGEKKRDDAICRETDGVCAPAVMKGGEERVERKRRRRASQTTTSPLRRKRQSVKNVHGGGQNKLFL